MPRRRLKAKPTKLKAAEDIMLPNVSDPSQRRSDVTGKVVRLLAKDGGSVKSGQPYVKCEAMKMIMHIKASQDGKVGHKLIADSILTTSDIITSLELADPCRVVKIESFRGIFDIESGPSDQRPLHFLNLALKDFPIDTENQLSGALLDVSAEEASGNCTQMMSIETFCDTEDKIKDKTLDLAVFDLINANQASTAPVVEAMQAHSSLKSRSALVMAVLRNINSFVDCAPGYAVPARVDKAFECAYSEVSTFFSAAILNDFRASDFTSHLAELKVLIMSDALESVCKLSKLALNVDFLSHFWSSAEENIRNTALEAYIRCVYRMHTISDVTILAKYSTRLLELRVDELQVKARISLQGLG